MKSYRKQVIECVAKGIQYEEDCMWCGKPMLMCRKYGGGCRSSKCMWARMTIMERLRYNPEENKKKLDEILQFAQKLGQASSKTQKGRKNKTDPLCKQ